MTSHEHEDLTIVERPSAPVEPEPESSPAGGSWPGASDAPADAAQPAAAGEQVAGSEPHAPAAPDGLEVKAPEAAEAEADPFAGWPGAEPADVVEDASVVEEDPAVDEAPAEGLEHAGGELDVPDGYAVVEGEPRGRRRAVAVVVSRFNAGLTNRMLARALEALEEAGVARESITVVPVPGAFELPLAAMALAKTRRYACVVALGAVVRGETPHFDYVAGEAASGLQLAGIETGIPVSFGVLTVETVEQGEARIDRAADAVSGALEMADLFSRLRASLRA